MATRIASTARLTTLTASTCAGLAVLFSAAPAQAYLGPGAGLGMIGSLIAIVVVGLVIVLGLVVYPIRMLRRRRAQSVDETPAKNEP